MIFLSYRVVFDTNILVSAIISRGNEFLLLDAVSGGKLDLFISPSLFSEFFRVLSYPRLQKHLRAKEERIDKVLGLAFFVEPDDSVEVIREDPSDNRVLECALAAEADFIVSGDKHLLKLEKFRGIPIIRSRSLLELLT